MTSSFSNLSLAEPLARAVAEMGYETMTPIQELRQSIVKLINQLPPDQLVSIREHVLTVTNQLIRDIDDAVDRFNESFAKIEKDNEPNSREV